MTAHAHQDAEGEIFGHKMRTAVAHKGQRGAGDGQESDVHTHMNDELSREIDGDARSEKYVEIIGTVARYHEYADNEDAEKADEVFTTLMGQEVAPRKKFIQLHATSANLDI